MIFEGIFV